MDLHSRAGRLGAAAGIGLLVALAAHAQKPPAKPASAVRGLWAMTAPFPTACYGSQDQFQTRNEAALAAVNADRERQEALNAKVEERFRSIDPMQLSQLMTQKMAEDPQNAMKYMEMMGATQDPGALTAQMQKEIEKEPRMQAEEKALMKRYAAAVQKAMEPAEARVGALRKKLNLGDGPLDRIGWPDWAVAEFDLIRLERNKAYVAVCPQWWGAQGQMQGFMQRYKDYLVKERIPFAEQQDARRTAQYAMADTPAESYRSLATHEAVADYIKLAGRLFGGRNHVPFCSSAQPTDCMENFQ